MRAALHKCVCIVIGIATQEYRGDVVVCKPFILQPPTQHMLGQIWVEAANPRFHGLQRGASHQYELETPQHERRTWEAKATTLQCNYKQKYTFSLFYRKQEISLPKSHRSRGAILGAITVRIAPLIAPRSRCDFGKLICRVRQICNVKNKLFFFGKNFQICLVG